MQKIIIPHVNVVILEICGVPIFGQSNEKKTKGCSGLSPHPHLLHCVQVKFARHLTLGDLGVSQRILRVHHFHTNTGWRIEGKYMRTPSNDVILKMPGSLVVSLHPSSSLEISKSSSIIVTLSPWNM